MLTKSGVKVLDFGLATMRAAAPLQTASPSDEGAATAKLRLVSERTLLGTVHYMAPERLEGCEANAASDLFAFGAVMYEMATGRRAVRERHARRRDRAPSCVRILRRRRRFGRICRRRSTGSIQKSLAKNPDARWRAAGDMVEVLRWMARGGEHAPRRAPRRRRLLPLALVRCSRAPRPCLR